MTVSVGRQPWAAGNSTITAYMMNNKTFERFAADAGYDLTVDYRDYPSAAPMVEAFVSGNLNFGMWGNTPIVRLIAQNQPIQLLSVGEGHEIAREVRHQLLHHLSHLGSVTVHVDPEGQGGERHHRIERHTHDDLPMHGHD